MSFLSLKSNSTVRVAFAILVSLFLSTGIFSQNVKEINSMPEISGKIVSQIIFENISGLIVLPVKINDSKVLNMILDTGMSAAVVVLFHKESIEELKLENPQEALLGGAGGEKQKMGYMFTNVKVNLQEIEMKNQTLIVFDESNESSEWSWDGVIGKSLFDSFVTEIDYEKSLVTFYNPVDYHINNNQSIPLNLDAGFPVIESELKIGLNPPSQVKLVVDLGHRSTFFIKEDSAKGIITPSKTIDGIAGRGIQGIVYSRIGRVNQLKISNSTLSNITTSFLTQDSNMGVSSTIADGNIGNLVLNRFKVILDYTRKEMYLIANKSFNKPFEVNMAGLFFEQDVNGVALVRYVMKHSPAYGKGIKERDNIISINGKDIRIYNFNEVQDLFTQPGNEIEIICERENQEFTVKIKLKKLI